MTLCFGGNSAAKGKTTETTDHIDAHFTALEPDELIVWAVQFVSEDPRYAGIMTMSWMLESCDGGTEVQIVAQDIPSGIDDQHHLIGMRSSLRKLVKHVE